MSITLVQSITREKYTYADYNLLISNNFTATNGNNINFLALFPFTLPKSYPNLYLNKIELRFAFARLWSGSNQTGNPLNLFDPSVSAMLTGTAPTVLNVSLLSYFQVSFFTPGSDNLLYRLGSMNLASNLTERPPSILFPSTGVNFQYDFSFRTEGRTFSSLLIFAFIRMYFSHELVEDPLLIL